MKLIYSLLCVGVLANSLTGCKKEDHQGGGTVPDAVIVAVAGADIAPDGGLSEQGLKKLSDVPSDKKIALSVVRSKLSDKSLAQLAKYPNLKSVEAIGSPLSPKAIDELKKSIPDVQVSK